jgi:N-acetylmuramoyl-L-alanine amidase
MGKLTLLILHCTATPEGRNVTPDEIMLWHLSPPPKGRGWKQVGYSDMIDLHGNPINLVRYNEDDIVDPWEITNGATGVNGIARHAVYVGGTDKQGNAKDTRNAAQLDSMKRYVLGMIKNHPSIKVGGHNQFAAKACPSFNVPEWLRSIGVAKVNIYQPSK